MNSCDPPDDRLGDLYKSLPMPSTPTGLAGRLQARLRRRRVLRFATGALAASLAIGAALIFWPRPEREPDLSSKSPITRVESPFAAPPVDDLSELTRDLAALEMLGKD